MILKKFMDYMLKQKDVLEIEVQGIVERYQGAGQVDDLDMHKLLQAFKSMSEATRWDKEHDEDCEEFVEAQAFYQVKASAELFKAKEKESGEYVFVGEQESGQDSGSEKRELLLRDLGSFHLIF